MENQKLVDRHEHDSRCRLAVESELIASLRKGSIHAFDELYRSYSAKLYNNILTLVKDTDIAEDILQELFQRVWEHRGHLDPAKSFKSYLFTIGKNLVYDFFRERNKRRDAEAHLITVSTELYQHVNEALIYKELETKISEAIDQLPPQRKLVYTLCKIEGKSYEDASLMLGISVSTISDHIVKATKFIKTRFLSEHAMLLLTAITMLA